MTLSTDKKITYISLLSGLVLGTLLISITYLSSNATIILLLQFVATIVLGLAAGFMLKDKMAQSYLIATSALFYTYAVSNLFAITKSILYLIFVLLVAAICLGLFYLSNKFFNYSKLSKIQKLLIAIGGYIVLTVICSTLGLYITRVVASTIFNT